MKGLDFCFIICEIFHSLSKSKQQKVFICEKEKLFHLPISENSWITDLWITIKSFVSHGYISTFYTVLCFNCSRMKTNLHFLWQYWQSIWINEIDCTDIVLANIWYNHLCQEGFSKVRLIQILFKCYTVWWIKNVTFLYVNSKINQLFKMWKKPEHTPAVTYLFYILNYLNKY